jgi:Glycosyl hydrolase family 14
MQAVMSFHAAGGNVGDTCHITLPQWVLDVGEANPDIFYTDKEGFRNRECLSLGCDEEALFAGRTPIDIYRNFMAAFADTFQHMFGEQMVTILQMSWHSTPAHSNARHSLYCSNALLHARLRFGGVRELCARSLLDACFYAMHLPQWLDFRTAGSCITEVTVGMGPAGELRYPAYPEGDGRWRFPGVGEFQCYDAYMLADLSARANALGQPEW